jgi:branched-chain amino acid aminotransferase
MNAHSKIAFSRRPTDRPVAADVRAGLLKNPGFGKVFTHHMVTIRWTQDRGWHDAEVRARAPITLDPAAAVLHYGQEIFEGLKAYNLRDGSFALFRPVQNARRFRASAARMTMPDLPEAMFLQGADELVKIDSAWIPKGDGSLYLRPFMFATEAFLGVRPSCEYLFILIASSVGSYFKGGEKPVTVWLTDRYTRAAEGGTGAAKCGGNYAASLLAEAEAMKTAAIKSCSSMRSNIAGSRNSEA